jgi:hypothetical protein
MNVAMLVAHSCEEKLSWRKIPVTLRIPRQGVLSEKDSERPGHPSNLSHAYSLKENTRVRLAKYPIPSAATNPTYGVISNTRPPLFLPDEAVP